MTILEQDTDHDADHDTDHDTEEPGEVAYDLRLYVAGQSPKSIRAIENLRTVCDQHLQGRYRIEVIDLLENPKLARGDEIIAVPTLVRKLPRPIRAIIGDLSNTDQVLIGLQLRPEGGPAA